MDAGQVWYWAQVGGVAALVCGSAGFGVSALADRIRRRRHHKSQVEEWRERDACPRFSQIPVTNDTSHPRASWPPSNQPAEALPVQDLMAINSALIRDLCYASKLSEDEYEAYLLPVIANLAHVVHLLPASAYDHHQGYGGLFVHCLECAYYAANQAKNTIFDRSSTPKEIHWNRRRWILTCILAALVHDTGKPYTDMEVTSKDGRSWNKTMPLLDWLRKEGIESYYVTFLSDRTHNEHVSVAVQKMESVIPRATFAFLGSTGVGERMQNELRSALNDGAKGSLVGKILMGADALSREADALRQRQIHPAYKNVAHPQGDPLLKAIRALVNSGKWTTNYNTDSQIFNTRLGCFIVWKEDNVRAIFNQATALGFTGLPQSSAKIAEILIDAKAAIPNTSGDGHLYSNLWNITPILMKDGDLMCLRMKDPNYIYDSVAPAQIETLVEGIPPDDVTKKAWEARWKCQPVLKLSAEEAMEEGLDPDYIQAEIRAAQEREALEAETAALEDISYDDPWTEGDPQSQAQAKIAVKTALASARGESTDALLEAAMPESVRGSSPVKGKKRERLAGEDIAIAPDEKGGAEMPARKTPEERAAEQAKRAAERAAANVFDRTTKSLADNFPAPSLNSRSNDGKSREEKGGRNRTKDAPLSDEFLGLMPESYAAKVKGKANASQSTEPKVRSELLDLPMPAAAAGEAAQADRPADVGLTALPKETAAPEAMIEAMMPRAIGESFEENAQDEAQPEVSEPEAAQTGGSDVPVADDIPDLNDSAFPDGIEEPDDIPEYASDDPEAEDYAESAEELSEDAEETPEDKAAPATDETFFDPETIPEPPPDRMGWGRSSAHLTAKPAQDPVVVKEPPEDEPRTFVRKEGRDWSVTIKAEPSPVKEKNQRARKSQTKKRLSVTQMQQVAQNALMRLREQMIAGFGEWISGVTTENGVISADLSLFEAHLHRGGVTDMSLVSAVAARLTQKPQLVFDLKARKVFLVVV